MKIREPSYYAAFACAAGACPDTCCRSWEVVVDEETRQRYETLEGPLGDRVRACLRRDEEGDSYLAFREGGCPMLRKDGLCSLQAACGAQMLSRVCNQYPRFRYEFGNLAELGVSLSCPAACRLILEAPFSMVETVTGDPPSLNDIDPSRFYTFLRGRETAFRLASDRRFPVPARMALLLDFGEALETAVGNPDAVLAAWSNSGALPGKLAALRPRGQGSFLRLRSVFQEMEPLTDRWPAMLAALDRCPPLPNEVEAERLLQYFLYKYFLQAAYDGKLLKKLQFAAASLLMMGALFAALPPENQAAEIDLLHLYSRETEHSEENLARFYRWAGKQKRGLFRALLLAE